MVLRGEADPHQVGAFLMLLRFRGEDAEEIAGLVEAARQQAGLAWRDLAVGAGLAVLRRRAHPRRAVVPAGRAGAGAGGDAGADARLERFHPAASTSRPGCAALGMRPAGPADEARAGLQRDGFAYVPLRTLSPAMDQLLGMRRLFGLRSPVNTAARLLNPADAPVRRRWRVPPALYRRASGRRRTARPRPAAGAEGRRRRGGAGAAEAAQASLWDSEPGGSEVVLPAVPGLRAHPAASEHRRLAGRRLARRGGAGDAGRDGAGDDRPRAAGAGAQRRPGCRDARCGDTLARTSLRPAQRRHKTRRSNNGNAD